MPMQFTPSQQKALSSGRHLAIIANAGSGKTRVLVRRYVDLFLRHPDLGVRNVVAITFTENAAAELRKRILEEITDRLASLSGLPNLASGERELRDRLRRLRDSFPSAFIGTIHGFASRILKAYPVEANIDAGFTILQGAERTILEEDAIQRTFYSALEEAYAAPVKENVLQLFRKLGRHELRELIRVLIGNRTRARRVQHDLLQQADHEILNSWRFHIETELPILRQPSFGLRLLELTRHAKAGKIGQEYPLLAHSFAQAQNFFCKAAALFEACRQINRGARRTIQTPRKCFRFQVRPARIGSRSRFDHRAASADARAARGMPSFGGRILDATLGVSLAASCGLRALGSGPRRIYAHEGGIQRARFRRSNRISRTPAGRPWRAKRTFDGVSVPHDR